VQWECQFVSQNTEGRKDLPAERSFEAITPEMCVADDPQAGAIVEGSVEAAALQMAVVACDRLDLQEVGHRSSLSLRQTRGKPTCRSSSALVIGPAAVPTSL